MRRPSCAGRRLIPGKPILPVIPKGILLLFLPVPGKGRREPLRIQKLSRNLLQEPAGRAVPGFPIHHALAGRREHQLLLGPGNAHIAEPPLLLHIRRVVGGDGHIARKQPVLHSHQIHSRKFQALGTVKGHERHPLLGIVHAVNIRHQGHLLQKFIQGRGLAVLLIGRRLIYQLLNIFHAGLGFHLALGLQLLTVARLLHNGLYQLLDGDSPPMYAVRELLHLLHKGLYLSRRLSDSRNLAGIFKTLKKAHAPLRGECRHPAHGRRPDSPLWHIDNAQHGQIIHPVGNGPQIGQNILNLLSLVEIDTAHQPVGHIVKNAPLLQKPGLGVRPVEDRLFLISLPAIPNLPRHKIRLVLGRLKLDEAHLAPLAVGCPERLVLAAPIVANYSVCRIQDILGGAVILLQLNHPCAGKCLLKAQNIPDIRPPEPVNRLVVIPHHAEILVLGRQKAHQLKLRVVGILVLVHHNIAEPLLVIVQNLGIILKKLHGLSNEVVEVQGIVLL